MKKVMVLILLLILVVVGCSNGKEINYDVNQNVFNISDDEDSILVNGYMILSKDGRVVIKRKDNEFEVEVELPDQTSVVQSIHFSHDSQFLAFDALGQEGMKMFVVNLTTGGAINLSDEIGYEYTYQNYQEPFGLAWSPNQNIIAFIGGDEVSPRINMYHMEMDLGKQASGASFAFEDIYGVKWNEDGSSIYYVTNGAEGESLYRLYETEVESEDYVHGGAVEVITDLTEEEFNSWFGN